METVKVQLRNDKGLALGNAFSAHPSELSLAEPGKKAKVIILSGQNKGRTGVVKVSFDTLLIIIYQYDFLLHLGGSRKRCDIGSIRRF
jgi:hypothetical protein